MLVSYELLGPTPIYSFKVDALPRTEAQSFYELNLCLMTQPDGSPIASRNNDPLLT